MAKNATESLATFDLACDRTNFFASFNNLVFQTLVIPLRYIPIFWRRWATMGDDGLRRVTMGCKGGPMLIGVDKWTRGIF